MNTSITLQLKNIHKTHKNIAALKRIINGKPQQPDDKQLHTDTLNILQAINDLA